MTQPEAERHFTEHIYTVVMDAFREQLNPAYHHSLSMVRVTDPATRFYNYTFRYNEVQTGGASISYKVIGAYDDGRFIFTLFQNGLPAKIDEDLTELL